MSQAWFYKWRRGDASLRRKRRAALAAQVDCLFCNHRSYGSPRIPADLRAAGWRVSVKTVAKLIAKQGLIARRKRRRYGCTRRDRSDRKAPDALVRAFARRRGRTPAVAGIDRATHRRGRYYLASVPHLRYDAASGLW